MYIKNNLGFHFKRFTRIAEPALMEGVVFRIQAPGKTFVAGTYGKLEIFNGVIASLCRKEIQVMRLQEDGFTKAIS